MRERESSMSSWKTVLTGSESSVGAAWPPVWLCETLKELFTAASESELFGEDEGGTTTTSCSSVVRGEDEDSSDVLMLTEEEKGDMKKKLNSCCAARCCANALETCVVREREAIASAASSLSSSSSGLREILINALIAEECAWRQLGDRSGWKLQAWREAFTCAQIFAVRARLLFLVDGSMDTRVLRWCMRRVDMCFIMGGPKELLQPYVDIIEREGMLMDTAACGGTKTQNVIQHQQPRLLGLHDPVPSCVEARQHAISKAGNGVREAKCTLSNADFRAQFFDTDTPVVFRAYGQHMQWRCVSDDIAENWCSLETWKRRYGVRTIPLEVGLPKDDDWHETVTRFSSFIDDFLIPSSASDSTGHDIQAGGVAYLAQHPLFAQLPALQEDFSVPSWIADGELTRVNSWIGSRSTVSPLHYDSYENFFAQIAGYKVIKVLGESFGECVYPHAVSWTQQRSWPSQVDSVQCKDNDEQKKEAARRTGTISQVDVECPDFERFPEYRNAEANVQEVVLGPGDVMYIPSRVWHHVRALTTSISLNFLF